MLLATTIAATVLLTGCTAKQHLSVRLNDGVVSFVNCEPLQATRVSVYAAPTGTPWSKSAEVWSVVGGTPIGANAVITLGTPPPGFDEQINEVPQDLREYEFEVAFVDNTRQESKVADFDGRLLAEGKWLNWEGRVVDSPCDG